jgi:hypothetical protein
VEGKQVTQQEATESWWFDADDVTRERALRLEGTDLLPNDMALDLQMAGVTVTAVDTIEGPAHVIPDVVLEFLDAARALRFE